MPNQQDRVEALQRLIQQNQVNFFDALANHPERQQAAVQHLLQAHRESLEETATEQFSDVPEQARRQALDQHMQNLQRQMTSCLVGFAGNQLALSPLVHIDDYRQTLCYKVCKYLESLGYKLRIENSSNFRHACICSTNRDTLIDIYKPLNVKEMSWLGKLFFFFTPDVDEEDLNEKLCSLMITHGTMEFEVNDGNSYNEVLQLANNIAHLFQVEITVQL
ncbi:MAG: hypothetical protein WC663_02145 [Patescibacteria group bacterium]|jgi:hypothetical protein